MKVPFPLNSCSCSSSSYTSRCSHRASRLHWPRISEWMMMMMMTRFVFPRRFIISTALVVFLCQLHMSNSAFNLKSLELAPTYTVFLVSDITQFSTSSSQVARSRYVKSNATVFDSPGSSSTSSNPRRTRTGPSGSPWDRY